MTEIKANYDETWKEIIGEYFELFLLFFYPEIHQQINWQKKPISLDKELEQITASAKTEKRHADKLFQVWLKNNQKIWLLIHIEVQSQYDKEFPKRMFIYNYRAFDLYNKPVISLAILGDENKSWHPNFYQYGLGKSQVKIEFSTVKLLDYKWEELEQNNNVFAIVVMAHLKTKATNKNLTLREEWKSHLSRLLYERSYHEKEIADLLKIIDLMMSLPQELQISFEEKLTNYQEEQKMPLLMNIEQRALARGQEIGQQIGQQIGQEIGAKETCQQNIIDLLQTRFGNLPESLVKAIQKIDNLALLKKLHLDTIKVNSLSEFEQLINNWYYAKFEEKLTNYQEEQKMPLLMNIEQRALTRGQEIGEKIGEQKGAKETCQQNIIDLMETRFGNLPESLVKAIQKIDNLALLKQLLLDTIKVNSLSEFEQLINNWILRNLNKVNSEINLIKNNQEHNQKLIENKLWGRNNDWN